MSEKLVALYFAQFVAIIKTLSQADNLDKLLEPNSKDKFTPDIWNDNHLGLDSSITITAEDIRDFFFAVNLYQSNQIKTYLEPVKSFSGVYSHEDLCLYLNTIRENFDYPFTLELSSSNHSISLQYCPITKPGDGAWYIVDANFLPVVRYEIGEVELCARQIINSFDVDWVNKSVCAIFNTKIYAASGLTKRVKQKLIDLELDDNSKLPPAITKAKAKVTDVFGANGLLVSAQNGHLEEVDVLIAAGADVNKSRYDDVTPLCFATLKGHLDMVNALITAGADVDKAKNNGVTPLYVAAQEGHIDVIKTLIAAKADINAIGITGHNPLQLACLSPANMNKESLFRLLINHGADVYHKNDSGQTALDIAIENNNTAAIRVLNSYMELNNDRNSYNPNFFGNVRGDEEELIKNRISSFTQ